MGQYHDMKRRTWLAQSAVANGAEIVLTSRSNGWEATFQCAKRCAEVLGRHGFSEDDGVPSFRIALDRTATAIEKLRERFSVSLVDYFSDGTRSRFVLVWKIEKIHDGKIFPKNEDGKTYDLDEF